VICSQKFPDTAAMDLVKSGCECDFKVNSGTSGSLQFIKTSTRISSIAYHPKTNTENTSDYLHQLIIPIWLKLH
jgi:hypothetical protein